MPLYEYQCDSCGRRFELIRKFSDPPVETCQVCEGRVRKLLSSPAIQFKGTGWYITDYARKGKVDSKQAGDKPDTSTASSTGSPETKPSSTPAAASSTK